MERLSKIECPNGHGRMVIKSMSKEVLLRRMCITYHAKHFVCTECGIEADNLSMAAENQKALSDAYLMRVTLR